MALVSRRAPRAWRLSLAGCLLLFAGPLQAARLVPAIVNETEQRPTSIARGTLEDLQVQQDGVVSEGEPGEWQLGQYRLADELVDATVIAGFDNGTFRAETYAAAIDNDAGDFSFPLSKPDLREVWFNVMPDGNEVPGTPVNLNLSLSWQSSRTRGTSPSATITALTPNEFGEGIQTRAIRDQTEQVVRIGRYYRLDLEHLNEVTSGGIFSGLSLRASLRPITDTSAPEPMIPGDFNRDGAVDAADYSYWRDRREGPYDFNLDANGDSVIGTGDYQVWSEWFGTTMPAAATATPEPNTLLLGLLASAAAVWGKRGRSGG